VEIVSLGRDLHRDRRVYPNHSIFLYERNRGGYRGVRNQHCRTFCGRCAEVAHHDSIVVGLRIGNDARWSDRSGCHLQSRSSLWRHFLTQRRPWDFSLSP